MTTTTAGPVTAEERRALRAASREFLAPLAGTDAVAEPGPRTDRRALGGELGLPGIAVPDRFGGGDGGWVELAVVLEEAGRALLAAPYVSTVLAAAALLAGGQEEVCAALLPGLAAGERSGAVATIGAGRVTARAENGGHVLHGVLDQVVDGVGADVLVVAADLDGRRGFYVVEGGDGIHREPLPTLDPTRGQARIRFDGAPARAATRPGNGPAVLDRVRDLAAVALAAEGLGMAACCLETAVEYATGRIQFGRPVGSFQAVQHACADLLLDIEALRSLVGHTVVLVDADDPALPAAASAVAAFAPAAVRRVVSGTIQVLGGVGVTWDHPAHLYLKRAKATELLSGSAERHRRAFAARDPEQLFDGLTADAADRPDTTGDDGADPTARDLAARVADLLATAPDPHAADDRPFLAAQFDAGLAWVGFGAGDGGLGLPPHHQDVVDRALAAAGVHRANLRNTIGYGNAAPVLAAHGSSAQRRRYLRPCFSTEEIWCQLMSEPGAGSDVPGLATRARREGDGWRISGQKVWTSFAHVARWGLLVARTDPDVPKHAGLTCFVVDMTAPGVEVRPIRMLTGKSDFNEVFLDDVLVPDTDRVGEVGDGWRVVNANLAAERAAFAAAGDEPLPGLVALAALAEHTSGTPAVEDRLLAAVVASLAAYLTGARAHTEPDLHPAAVKILVTESTQDTLEAVLDLAGPAGSLCAPDEYTLERPTRVSIMGGDAVARYLRSRALTIEGGTSMVLRTVLAEKALRLPRGPRADLGVPWRDVPRTSPADR